MDGKEINFQVEPPLANRGVESTSDNSLSACVDWLSVTFLDEKDWTVICDVFGLENSLFIELERGRYGYRKMYFYNNISILCDGRENMGIHIELSGQGCRYFESESAITWGELFVRLVTDYRPVINVKRLDLAIDDTRGYFKITQAITNVKRGQTVSIFRKARRISNLDIGNGGEFGHTLYFGSPSSSIMFRFYDKLEEMKAKKKQVEDGITFWNRIELSAYDDRAEALVQILAEEKVSVGEIVRGLLLRYVKFKRKSSTDSNKYRWPLQPWYKKFLDDVEPLRITKKAPDKSIQKTFTWVNKSVVKALAMLAISFESNYKDMLDDFLADGQDKLSSLDWQIIDEFKKSKMSYFDFLKHLEGLEKTDFESMRERINAKNEKKSAINE